MGLAKRIIPCLLKRGSALVKGKQFSGDRVVGVAMQAARIYGQRGADEVCLLDIGATPEGRGPDLEAIRQLSQDFFTPLAGGGGISCYGDARRLLAAGADKVVIGYAWDQIADCSHVLGRQAVVAAVDVIKIQPLDHPPPKTAIVDALAVNWCQRMERRGAGEILLTSVDREGMMEGMDLEMIEKVSKAVDIPVIAHGGCGTPEHAYEAIMAGASAVAIGSMFQFTDFTPRAVALHLQAKGIEVRIP